MQKETGIATGLVFGIETILVWVTGYDIIALIIYLFIISSWLLIFFSPSYKYVFYITSLRLNLHAMIRVDNHITLTPQIILFWVIPIVSMIVFITYIFLLKIISGPVILFMGLCSPIVWNFVFPWVFNRITRK